MRAGSSKREVCCHSNEHSGNRNHGHGCPEPGKKNSVLLWLHRCSIFPYISVASFSGGATWNYVGLITVLLSSSLCGGVPMKSFLITHMFLVPSFSMFLPVPKM